MSNTRTFAFLKDSVSGLFYTGQQNSRMDFKNAAVYFQEKNAKSKKAGVIQSWEFQKKNADYWIEECKKKRPEDQKWAEKEKEDVLRRQDLPDWGVVVVTADVTI